MLVEEKGEQNLAGPAGGAGAAAGREGAGADAGPASAGAAARPAEGGHKSAREVITSPEFKALVARRWAVSFTFLALLFASYYGYILLIAADREFVSRKVGEVTTLAIPLGVGAIVVAWALTAAYVAWANRSYDPEVDRLKRQLRPGPSAPPAAGGPAA